MNDLRLKLVSFDLDGTILRSRMLDYVKISKALRQKIVLQDDLFSQSRLGYEKCLEIQYGLLAGLEVDQIAPNPEQLPVIGDLDATIEKLKRAHVAAVILTDNPLFTVEPLRSHGFQDIIASELETSEGVLTGRMRLLTNKLEGLRRYCTGLGIGLESCAHVGDWINDVVVFRGVGLSVAFNPSEDEVSEAATYTVRSDSLLDVYNVLEPSLPDRKKD
jgi:phosphoserine phosphatase